ncbi:putative nuclease HARBI1, partial [Tanacetum coccineum]
ELKREERELKKEERNTKKMYLSHLNALLAKDHVSPEEEDMKRNLYEMLYENSISSNSIEYHEWESRVVQYNQRTDRILEDVIINYPNLVIQDQPSRARRVYHDREREQDFTCVNTYFFILLMLLLPMIDISNKDLMLRVDKVFHHCKNVRGGMRVLAYGMSFDAVDEYLRMSGVVTRKSLMSFVQGVISCFGDEYLRRPNENDLTRLLYLGEQRGFPSMIGSIDCMHWKWKNCPTGWAGQYAGRSGKPTIILETAASYDLWIWHAFFGTPGSCNDINVLHRSHVFSDVLEGRAPKESYVVNVEDERDTYRNFDPSEFFNDMHTPGNEVVEYSTKRIANLRSYMRNREQLRNRKAHSSIKNDLTEHIWQKFGDDN